MLNNLNCLNTHMKWNLFLQRKTRAISLELYSILLQEKYGIWKLLFVLFSTLLFKIRFRCQSFEIQLIKFTTRLDKIVFPNFVIGIDLTLSDMALAVKLIRTCIPFRIKTPKVHNSKPLWRCGNNTISR